MNNVDANSNIKQVERADIRRAGAVMAAAFRNDPLFAYYFGDPSRYERIAPWMFATFVRWTNLYGKAWAIRDPGYPGELSAVALRQPPGTRAMNFWNTVRSGVLFPFLTMDAETRRRFGRVSQIVVEKHKQVMGAAPHWHCWVMGVEPTAQGKGVGRQLMRHTFAQSDRAGLPCYLETCSETAVRVHESQLYQVRDAVKISGTQLTLYAMVRPPQS